MTFNTATVEDWHKVHGVNGLGVFLCYKYAALKMQELGNKSGRIIGASSALGRAGATSGCNAMDHGTYALTDGSRQPEGWRVLSD